LGAVARSPEEYVVWGALILCWSGDKLWDLHVLSDELSLRNYLAGGKGTPKQREAREEHTGENRAALTPTTENSRNNKQGIHNKEQQRNNKQENAHNREQQARNSQQRTAGTTSKKTPTTENSKQGITRETRSNESAAIGLRPQVFLIV
jgi:hypothetical protein